MKKSPLKNSTAIIVISLVLIVAVVGGLYWYQTTSQAASAAAPILQTSRVRTGDLIVSATGTGNLLPAAQVDLGFRTTGIVEEVNVIAGQLVKKGDVLARLDDAAQQLAFIQAEANVKALFDPAGLATYQIDLANAQNAYDTALSNLQYLISPSVYRAELQLIKVQSTLAQINADTTATAADKADAQKAVDRAQSNLMFSQKNFNEEYVPATFTYTWTDDVTREEISQVIPPTATDISLARATLEKNRLALSEAQAALDILIAGDPAALKKSLTAASGSSLAKIKADYLAYENARLALENARLIAPFDGTIVNVDLVPGQSANTNPIMTLAALDPLRVKFYMDETDLAGLAVGNRTLYTLDAYPESSLNGRVTLIESVLQTIDGSPAVVVWSSLDEKPSFPLLAGMTVEVEVIAGETLNTLIVPVQALRELDVNSYAVFVVQPDGSLKLTPVTVGLRDFANAEILSGLNAGDVVSTGNVETK
jgi:HlyD family secretion protein